MQEDDLHEEAAAAEDGAAEMVDETWHIDVRSWEDKMLVWMHDLTWLVPTSDVAVCVAYLRPWSEDDREPVKSTKCCSRSLADGDVGDWHGPPSELLDVADILCEANVPYLGEPRRMLVLRARESLGETPSTRLHNLQTSLATLLADGMPESGPFVWPLLSKKDLQEILDHNPHNFNENKCCAWEKVLSNLFLWRWRTAIKDYLNCLRDEVSPLTAYAFAYNMSFVQALWLLAPFCIAAAIWGDNGYHTPPVQRAVWEIFKAILVLWSAAFVASTWRRSQVMDLGTQGDMVDAVPPEGRRRKVAEGRLCSALRFALAWLLTVIFTGLNAYIVFMYVQFNAWLTFKWGRCVEDGCHDPQVRFGFWGWLAEVSSDIVQALLWLALMEINKSLGRLCADRRQHPTQEDRDRSVVQYTLFMEAFGKVLPLGVMGMLFVPAYSSIFNVSVSGEACRGHSFALWLNPEFLMCLATEIDGARRRQHFVRMFNGPFTVAPFIAILMKVIVPLAALGLDWVARRWPRCKCLPKWLAFPLVAIARILALILTFECDSVGCGGYVCQGTPFGEPEVVGGIYQEKRAPQRLRAVALRGAGRPSAGASSEVAASHHHHGDGPPMTLALRCCRAAIDQGSRKQFQAFDEMMEVNLFFLFVVFFAPVKPLGALFLLFARGLECHTDLAKLLFVRRRAKPKGTKLAHTLHRWYSVSALCVSIVWSVLLSTVVFAPDAYSL